MAGPGQLGGPRAESNRSLSRLTRIVTGQRPSWPRPLYSAISMITPRFCAAGIARAEGSSPGTRVMPWPAK